MIENLKRVREPVAWAILAVIVASMALSIVSLARQVSAVDARDTVFAVFAAIASNSMNLTLVFSLVAMVCVCLFIAPATAHAVGLARAALVVVSLGTLLTVVATGLGVAASAGIAGIVFELLGGILDLALKVVAVGVLWVIHRAVSTGRMATPAAPVEAAPEPPLPSRAIEPATPPVWRADAAAGTVWSTAAEAAAGSRPATPPGRAASAWEAPSGGAGAAESLGWRRVDQAGPSTERPGESRDTP